MVAVSRRTSSRRQEKEIQEAIPRKRQRKQSNPSPPAKRQKRSKDIFYFNESESEGEEVEARKSTRASVETGRKKGLTQSVNGGTPTKATTNGTNGTSRKRKRTESIASVPSDTSSDPLSSARFPATPSKRSLRNSTRGSDTPNPRTPSKSAPLKDSTAANGTVTPKGRETPVKSFKQKLEGVKSSTTKEKPQKTIEQTPSSSAKRNSKETPQSETIFDNDKSRTKSQSKSKVKPPTPQQLDSLKSTILSKLTGRSPVPLIGKSAEVATEIHNLMQRAIEGESNTLLLLGGPGSSKTTIVNTALNDLKKSNPEGGYYTIRLDGQIQLDDKIALKEIARQLALGMNVEMDKMSIADTLTTLLFTLSHPTEISDEIDESKTSASVIFILDSFDEFLTHPRQALLYNLFDIAQSRKAPIAVICLGRQVNAIDGLEKRVKSRFGGRILQVGRPNTIEKFWDVCKAALTVEETHSFSRAWNQHIEELWEDATMKELCNEIFVQSRDVREFFNRSIPVISSLDQEAFLPSADAWSSIPVAPTDSKLSLIEGLSQLELSLLIAATRLETFHALESFNFPMVYEIYSTLVSRSRTHTVTALGEISLPGSAIRLWGRDVAFKAWERLGEIGLWTYVSASGEGRGRFVRSEVGMMEVLGICERYRLLSSSMRSWFREGI